MDILVTYDIDTSSALGERRLARVAKVCEGYGIRAQYSVFECRVNDLGMVRLTAHLRDEIDPRCDSVNIYRFVGDVNDARLALGRTKGHHLGEPWIL
jgi:CRISPR-associated protein Cas2